MPGRGPAPKKSRRNTSDPARGEWKAPPGIGWQHGKRPAPPAGLLPVSQKTWQTWMTSWFASFWTPADLPGLEIVILLYDVVRRGEDQRASELRIQMDTYGITPKGQQDRRWTPPNEEPGSIATPAVAADATYGHLAAV